MKTELPGHIKKAFKSIDRFLPVVDLIIELVDARMPLSSRLTGLDNHFGKQSLIVLGKSDLADPKETKKWVAQLKSEGNACIALDSRNHSSGKKLVAMLQKLLFKQNSGVKTLTRKVRRLMIIGIPNVGKSTLINSLAGRKAARVANMPGVTRDIQWIKLPGQLELLDLPGILDFSLLRRGNILKLINTMPGNKNDYIQQARLLCEVLTLAGCAGIIPGLLEAKGKFDHFVREYANKMNFLLKGGKLDENRAAADLIKRFQSGGFGPVTIEKSDQDMLFYKLEETASEKPDA